MSSKDLQRVTECVSDIGQTPSRRSPPIRHHHVTQKIRVAGQRTLYLSVHDDPRPADTFLRLKGPSSSSELIDLCGVIAHLMNLAIQYGVPLDRVGDRLTGTKFEPCGPMSEYDRLNRLPWPNVGGGHNNGPTHRSGPLA